MAHPLNEKRESLWLLVVSPMIWAAHFISCYILAAIWCAKYAPRNGSLLPVRWAITGLTLVALVGIGLNGWSGFRRHRRGTESPAHDYDTPGDRHGFLGFASVLLSALSAIATIFAALVVIYFEDCR